MRKILFILVVSCATLLICHQPSSAQSTSSASDTLLYRPVQVSILPGLGTNGLDGHRYAVKYSFNLLAGYNGALRDGYEFGTIANIHKYKADGFQMAGIANVSGRNTEGIQLAGVGNVSGRSMLGVQLAGVGNVAGEDLEGAQLSGVLNASIKSMQGIQLSGLVNFSGDDMQGVQASGMANLSGKSIQGIQFTGGLNFAFASAQGLQFSSLGNIALEDMQGLFFSSGLNYGASLQGISVGAVNLNEQAQGIQIGFFNGAEKIQGLQVGVVNIADEMRGVPVGLISFVRKGRHNIDVFSSETGFTNIGLKLGTHQVYNMISIGINPRLDPEPWQVGWSIGRYKNEGNGIFTYSDFSIFHINEDRGWTDALNNRFTYRLMFGRHIADGFSAYIGPTFNMLVSRSDLNYRHTYYDLYSASVSGREYRFWIGLSGGLQIF